MNKFRSVWAAVPILILVLALMVFVMLLEQGLMEASYTNVGIALEILGFAGVLISCRKEYKQYTVEEINNMELDYAKDVVFWINEGRKLRAASIIAVIIGLIMQFSMFNNTPI